MPKPLLRNTPLSTVVCEVRFDAPPLEHILELGKRLEPLGLTQYAAEEGLQVGMRPGQIEQRTVRRSRRWTASSTGAKSTPTTGTW